MYNKYSRLTKIHRQQVPRWPAATREADVGPGLPRHMHRRGSLAAPPRLARQRQAYRRGLAPFLPPPHFLLLPEPACISRRRRRPAHPQIRRFVVGIVWEIDPRILRKVLPYLISVLALNFAGFCMYR
jgi:hypothetical protein